ncbi:hypothetical protein SCUCBS95973_009744 [Sporothrix curviconia]|uniref:Uncharacterized protein n=1 Tax=Sporothrix curviconia TaxID=1260050 RepID=A0ABP0CZ62_9PEZI
MVSPSITTTNAVDLLALSAFLEWLADGNKAQQILDRWPQPASGKSRLAAHWDARKPNWRGTKKVPAYARNGRALDHARFFEALFDVCIIEAHATLSAADDLRTAALTVRNVVAGVAPASPADDDLEATVVASRGKKEQKRSPDRCRSATFSLQADMIQAHLGSSLFRHSPVLSRPTTSYATAWHLRNGVHPLDLDNLEVDRVVFSGMGDDVVCTLAYSGLAKWCVTVKRQDIE